MNKQIRWKQRFQNLKQAFAQLEKGLAIAKPNDVEKQGIIQNFEFTFELAWKTLKDYLESQQVDAPFPRDVIKQSFHYQVISDGELWMDMLEKRNLVAHTYNETAANTALELIREKYFLALKQAMDFLTKRMKGWGLNAKTIERLQKIFARFPELREVRIFGSRTIGDFKPGSDVDLALFGEEKLKCTTRISALLNEELPLPYHFDVVDYAEVTNPDFLTHINQFGEVIYSREELK